MFGRREQLGSRKAKKEENREKKGKGKGRPKGKRKSFRRKRSGLRKLKSMENSLEPEATQAHAPAATNEAAVDLPPPAKAAKARPKGEAKAKATAKAKAKGTAKAKAKGTAKANAKGTAKAKASPKARAKAKAKSKRGDAKAKANMDDGNDCKATSGRRSARKKARVEATAAIPEDEAAAILELMNFEDQETMDKEDVKYIVYIACAVQNHESEVSVLKEEIKGWLPAYDSCGFDIYWPRLTAGPYLKTKDGKKPSLGCFSIEKSVSGLMVCIGASICLVAGLRHSTCMRVK